MTSSVAHGDFVVMDMEFTGLSPLEGDAIVEIAAVTLAGGAIVDTWHSVVRPPRDVPADIYALTGLTGDDVARAPRFADIAAPLLARIASRTIVTHNVAFDVAALEWELVQNGLAPLANGAVDTLDLARRVFPGERNNLRDLAGRLGITSVPSHRALDDARVTADVFLALVRELESRGLLRSARDLHAVDCRTFALRVPGRHDADWETIARSLVEAVEHKRVLRVRYASGGGAAGAERVIEPFCLIGPYLRAYCRTKARELNFTVSRIRSVEETGQTVTRLPEPPRGPAVFSPALARVSRPN